MKVAIYILALLFSVSTEASESENMLLGNWMCSHEPSVSDGIQEESIDVYSFNAELIFSEIGITKFVHLESTIFIEYAVRNTGAWSLESNILKVIPAKRVLLYSDPPHYQQEQVEKNFEETIRNQPYSQYRIKWINNKSIILQPVDFEERYYEEPDYRCVKA